MGTNATSKQSKKIVEFCDLDWYSEFASSVPETRDENVKWKAELSEQKNMTLKNPLRVSTPFSIMPEILSFPYISVMY